MKRMENQTPISLQSQSRSQQDSLINYSLLIFPIFEYIISIKMKSVILYIQNHASDLLSGLPKIEKQL